MPFLIDIDLPDEDSWIPLLLPDEDVEDWVEEACAAWEVPDHLLETYRTALAWHAEQYRRLDAYRGALFVPDVEAGIIATWWLDYGNWFEQKTVDLDQVEKAARDRERPGALQEGTVEQVTLPAGPAVRLREFDLAPEDAPDSSGNQAGADTTLVESVTHLLFPTGASEDDGLQLMVRSTLTWTEVVHGDELAGLADELAAGLSVHREA